jgi:hypothetical protein
MPPPGLPPKSHWEGAAKDEEDAKWSVDITEMRATMNATLSALRDTASAFASPR